MTTRVRIAFGLLALFTLGIQLVPVDRSNPEVRAILPASAQVSWLLRRSCYDCHSNETRWPIWAWIAPVSWHVVYDVKRGRAALNFSEWDRYSPERRAVMRTLVNPVVSAHRMPLWYYLPLHPDASVDDGERAVLAAWAMRAEDELRPAP